MTGLLILLYGITAALVCQDVHDEFKKSKRKGEHITFWEALVSIIVGVLWLPLGLANWVTRE